ncbi:hypothetical protein [Streptomyces sp. RFCAC02]|uniref:hypothetical protein n=1 Tax=Streptomyces sp. RFCAC02 TaxID=2499143 RepID=UPI00101F2802|nr:hypothetical protein [Streptomyces sp. RFCAC02]
MLIGTVCTLLTAAGLGVSFLVARRRRYAAALRIAGISLLPVGLAMTGVVRFVLNMTFNPLAWAGFGVLALAVLLFLSGRLADRSGGRRSEAAAPRAATGTARRGLPGRGAAASDAASPAAEFDEIEAILKKHGI